MRGRDVRQVADGMLAKVGPKPSIAKLSASIAREQAVVTSKSGKITTTMLDVPPVGGTYKMRMNRFVARDISVGLDGQTKAYIKPTAKEAKAIFSSKYVPMTDGTQLLTGADKKTMSQYGYGNVVTSSLPSAPKVRRIGFNNTLADTSGGKITTCMAGVIKHPNTAVYTDFPKGAGGASPNKLFVDGTYEETIAAIHKKQDERTRDLTLAPVRDIRKEVFQEQALAGGQIYGNELLKQQLENEFADQRLGQLEATLASIYPSGTPAELGNIRDRVEIERRAARIAQQLSIDAGSQTAFDLAELDYRGEQQRRERTAAIGAPVARSRSGSPIPDESLAGRIASAREALPDMRRLIEEAVTFRPEGGMGADTRRDRAAEAIGMFESSTARTPKREARQESPRSASAAAASAALELISRGSGSPPGTTPAVVARRGGMTNLDALDM